jgi:arylsulfatase A-like enzyme
MNDAFYRWDGFKYYASFSDFLPSVGLATIVWSAVAALASLVIWLLLRGFEWFCRHMGWKIKAEILLMFIGIFVLLVTAAAISKTLLTIELLTPVSTLLLLLSVLFVTIYLTWRYHNKFDIVHERIAPLVWLFGIWLIVSLPIVIYHTWIKQTNNLLAQKISRPSLSDTKRPNIILVSFDALTARDMSAYGYNKPTTPFITKWSKTASLFNRVYSASNWTTPSVASMMTGKRVWTHRMFHGDSKLFKSDTESLPLILKYNGYYNMAFIVNGYASVNRLGIANGFDIDANKADLSKGHTLIGYCCGTLDLIFYRLFADRIKLFNWVISPDFILGKLLREMFLFPALISQTEVPPELAFSKYLEAASNSNSEPFFAWIHLLPPHDPFLPGNPYTGMFDSSPRLRLFSKQMKEEAQAHRVKNKEDWAIYRARYDEFIRYCDRRFEDFVKELGKKDMLKKTVIIFTSDHGESFEHDYFTHNTIHHYEQVTHIPLIIKEPDQNRGVIINDLTDQIDVPPTILDLAGIPVPSWMEGRSLLPLMRGKKLLSKNVYSMSFQKNPSTGELITKGTIAVWRGDYKLIHYLDQKKSLLFNITQDPDELNNLFDKEQEIGQHLLSLIQEDLKKANERIRRGE